MNFITPAALLEPQHFSVPAPWAGHIPFGSWLVAVQKPETLVELGAYSGISYMAFCQAIKEQGLPTKAYAVDTWLGDAHAGAYGETIYQTLQREHDPRYAAFSTLLRMTFDEALPQFSNGSVDLLHIDGLHTYEAVRHDFETWLPKMSQRGVVLFHDTNVFRDDFGVHRLWAELSVRYPSMQFTHSNGLGVLLVGAQQPPELLQLCGASSDAATGLTPGVARQVFSILGGRLEQLAQVLILQNQLHDARERETQLERAGQQRHEWIENLDRQLLDLQWRNTEAENVVEAVNQLLNVRDAEVHALRQRLVGAEAQVQEIYASRSWRVTAGLRAAGKLARSWGLGTLVRRARKAAGYAVRGEWRALAGRLAAVRREAVLEQRLSIASGGTRHVGVMATPHTLFVAHLLAQALHKAGITVDVMTEPPAEGFVLDGYFVVCPQMFKHLPPGEKRIVFQMEQSVSPRWFTPEYLHTLENSLAVLDYAQANLQFLEKRGIAYPHTFLVPVGGFAGYGDYLRHNNLQPQGVDAPCDVLFYGDANAPRRQQLLEAVGERFQLRIVGNLFGPELHRAIASARVVVNLHYYEGALLETTRIYECLSLGVPLVSETSVDQAEHAALDGAVRFVPVGDLPALLQALDEVLNASPQQSAAAQFDREAVVEASQARFEFMLYRMLLARRWLDYTQFQTLTSTTPLPGPRLALSLPETTARRAMFVSHQMPGVQVFDGVRYSPGWIGAALSYKYLAQQALAAQWPQLEVMEDDVLFLPDYVEHKAVVDAYLAQRSGQWDVFVGLIAIMHPDTRVLGVERQGGLVFITIDRMISMVHNIYAPTVLRLLAQWDERHADPETNTIDRYLQTQSQLRVVTTLPFLVGHHEELHSSLWGIQNSQYAEIIAKAQSELEAKVRAFEQNTSCHGVT